MSSDTRGHPPVLGGDRRLPHPFLKARDFLDVVLHDLSLVKPPALPGDTYLHGVEAIGRAQGPWQSEREPRTRPLAVLGSIDLRDPDMMGPLLRLEQIWAMRGVAELGR